MSFLDRLRPQPRWKHADPAVRAAAVAEMPADSEHQQIIAELAGTDPDVRVRQAALGRLDSVVELVALVGREGNDDLRREISERLVAIASSASDGDGDAALALDGLSDQRQLAAVAKSSPHDTVRTAALGRIHDPRVLSSVARQATDASVALEAVNRVADAAELTSIASRTEHKDAGIGGL
jgi:DNA repair protein SbcC/Rad50